MPPIHKANTLLAHMSPPVNRDYCQKQDRDNDKKKKLNHFFRVHVNPLVYCLPLLTVTGLFQALGRSSGSRTRIPRLKVGCSNR